MSDLIERLREDAEWNSAPQLNDPAILKTAALEREAAKRIAELEAEVARVQALHEGLMKNADQMNDALRAERDALKVDAERYRWVRSLGDKSDEELDALDICTPKSSVDFDRIVDAFIGAAAKEQP